LAALIRLLKRPEGSCPVPPAGSSFPQRV